jgi:hypothetical protein
MALFRNPRHLLPPVPQHSADSFWRILVLLAVEVLGRGLQPSQLQRRSMLRYQRTGALSPVTAIPHSDRKYGLATRTAHPLPATAMILRHLPNLQRGAVEVPNRDIIMDLWYLSRCSLLRTCRSAWHTSYLFAHRQSILISHRLRGHVLQFSLGTFVRILMLLPWSRPAQLFITFWHTLYLCNIHPRQVSPSLSYPLLSPLLGMGTYLLPGDVDTEPPIGGLCRSLSLLRRASAPSTVIIARVVTIVQ